MWTTTLLLPHDTYRDLLCRGKKGTTFIIRPKLKRCIFGEKSRKLAQFGTMVEKRKKYFKVSFYITYCEYEAKYVAFGLVKFLKNL